MAAPRRFAAQRSARLLAAQQHISAVLVAGGRPETTVAAVLEAVCTSLDGSRAQLWRLNRAASALRWAASWPALSPGDAFAVASREPELPSGVGLPGRVWSTERPAWIPDIRADRNFPRADAAEASGLRFGMAVPLAVSGAFLGALELLGGEVRELEPAALEAAASMGDQLAQHLALTESRARFEAVAASVADAIVMADRTGHIVSWNIGAERIFGYRADEAVGRELTLLMPDRHVEAHRAGFARLTRTGQGRLLGRTVELSGRRKGGEEFPLELTLAAMQGGEEALYSGIIRDLTDRRRAEELSAREIAQRAFAAEQSALRRVATAVASGVDPALVFGLAAREVAALLGADTVTVIRLDEGSGAAGVVGRSGADAASGADATRADVPAVVLAALREGRASSVDRLSELDGDPVAAGMTRAGLTGAAAAPVRVGTRLWGAVAMATRDGLPPDAEERLAQVAYLVALTVGNAEVRAALLHSAASDPLTGLANHRAFHERLHSESERARRHGRELAVALIDLDHFKHVNDTRGHQAGDGVLVEAGRRLAALAAEGELVARINGGGFAWILPEHDSLAAYARAERGRQVISAAPFPAVGRQTASAGVCDLRQAGDVAEMLVQLADGALYWAKTHGRDCTYRYTPEVVEALSAAERAELLHRNQALAGLRALARAVDAKDPSTQAHSERVAELAARIARASGWPATRVAHLREAALIHDVGKIGVPDAVLFKPAGLEPDEYELVKQHADLGAEIAAEVLSAEQVAWIRAHHERWDGRGYPRGLAGEAIPREARVLALADAWDVMTNFRHYKSPITPDEALAECRRQSGHQFWPGAVAALERLGTAGLVIGADEAVTQPLVPFT